MIKKLWRDYMKSPKSIKIITVCLMLSVVAVSILVIFGCQGPGKNYIIKMDARAALHFPRYEFLIDTASKEQLEKILEKDKNAYKNASEKNIKFLKESLILEIQGWHFLIKANRKLLEKQKK